MRIRFSAVCAVIIAVQTAFCPLAARAYPANAPQESDHADSLNAAFDRLTGERGGFFEGLKFGQSDWAAYCAARIGGEYAEGAGEYILGVRDAADELMGRDFVPPTELQRAAIVLSGFGECSEELIRAAAYDNDNLDKQGLNAWIWALIAANCSGFELEGVNSRESLAGHIAGAALSDGGYNLRGEVADCDITAAAIYALAPLEDCPEAEKALNAALDCLTDMQLESGGFSSMGIENCESTAQAIIAFTAAGHDLSDSRVSRALSAMLEYREEQGFAHISGGGESGMATVQALQALTALTLRERGERLFDTGSTVIVPGEAVSSAVTAESGGSAAVLTQKNTESGGETIKLIVSVTLAAAGLAVIFAGVLKKKRTLFLSVIFFAASGGVWLLQSPSEYYSQTVGGDMTVTVSADCSVLLTGTREVGEGVIPQDGVVIAEVEINMEEGATAFDALIAAAREQQVAVDHVSSFYGEYVRGIGNIYEFDFGNMSGWIYKVNGESPNVSAGKYSLSEGDVVEFIYTIG